MRLRTIMSLAICTFGIAAGAYCAGSCNQADQQIFGHNARFNETWRTCGENASGHASATVHCIRESYPNLSLECGNCFGSFTSCAAHHCWSQCMVDSASVECKQCGLSNCGPGWEQCSGSHVGLISG